MNTRQKQKPTRAFIVAYVTPDEYCFERRLEEGVFDCYEKAHKYVKYLVAQYADDGSFPFRVSPAVPRSYIQIESYVINDRKPWKSYQRWAFEENGKLISAPKEGKGHRTGGDRFDPNPFTAQFKVGDIVLVKALPWNEESHFAVDHIGVIAWAPMPLKDWLAKGEDKDEWVGDYVVEFINSSGYLDHDHVLESGIERYRKKLPKEVSFLKTLSNHYLGKRRIKESLLPALYRHGIFVRKVRHFGEDCLEK